LALWYDLFLILEPQIAIYLPSITPEKGNRIRIHIDIVSIIRQTFSVPCDHLRSTNRVEIVHINVCTTAAFDAEDAQLARFAVLGVGAGYLYPISKSK
jgi:hypothetical protein